MSYFDTGSTQLVSRQGYSGVGLDWSDVTGVVKDIGGNVLNFYGQQQKQAGAAEAYAEMAKEQAARDRGGLPSWVLPVGLVVGGFFLIKSLRKK